MIDIKICCNDGHKKSVSATLLGPLAVHRSIDWVSDWRITHVATGCALPVFFSTKAGALAAAKAVLPMADWTFTDIKTPVRDWSKRKRNRIGRTMERFA